MNDDRIGQRVTEVRELLLDGVLSACRRIDVEPQIQLGIEGTCVLNGRGQEMARLRMVLDERDGGLVARIDVRCERLRRAMIAHDTKPQG